MRDVVTKLIFSHWLGTNLESSLIVCSNITWCCMNQNNDTYTTTTPDRMYGRKLTMLYIMRRLEWQYGTQVFIMTYQSVTRTTRTPLFWDTPHRPMITHTSDSHQIPSQNKTKSKLQILKNCRKFKLCNFAKKLYMWHTFWSCLIRCINMKWIQPELQALQERTRDAGGTDRRTDGQNETNIPSQQLCRGYNNI